MALNGSTKALSSSGPDFWVRLVRGALLTLSVSITIFFSSARADSPRKYLIEWSWGDHDSPGYIAGHMSFIETRPFDGIVINNYPGRNFFSVRPDGTAGAAVWTADRIAMGFTPLNGDGFKKFRQNFAKVNMGMRFNPPELDDDVGWAMVVVSARNYAAVIRAIGITGIFLDNEIYTYSYWRKANAGLFGGKGDFQRRAGLARQRGRQLMAALLEAYPNIVVIVAHSPAENCTETPRNILDYSPDPDSLAGYFFSGMAMAVQSPAMLVDGGEFYSLRSDSDFAESYRWRKRGIAASGCGVVPDELRSAWGNKVGIGFGVYDTPSGKKHAIPMNAAIAASTLRSALQAADLYVWHYSEARDWWGEKKDAGKVPAVSDDWIEAVDQANGHK